jgi:hypothetical protein
MQLFTIDEFRRLPTIGQHVGETGAPMSGLWEWTLTYRQSPTKNKHEPSPVLQLESEIEAMVLASIDGSLGRRPGDPFGVQSKPVKAIGVQWLHATDLAGFGWDEKR